MFKRLSAIAAVLLIVVLVAGCGGGGTSSSSSSSSTTSSSSSASTSATSSSSTSAANVKRIEVTLSEFAFTPNVIEVNRGDQVEIVFTNTGALPHDFRIDALNVDSGLVQPGESKTITFTASRAGEFEIHCAEPGHAPSGMTGTFKVIG